MFSLNLSSAGKGPFMGSKAKHNYAPEAHFSGGGRGGGGQRGDSGEEHGPALAGKFRSLVF